MALGNVDADLALSAESGNSSDEEGPVSVSCDESPTSSSSEHASSAAESEQSNARHAASKMPLEAQVVSKGSAVQHGSSQSEKGNSPAATQAKRPLRLLDLPVDVLKEIVKEITHTNDLTSLALTCSALHGLAIPHMYSRFDIVWPDGMPASDQPAGVDALSYGLATLVMGEDVFRETPHRPSRSPCPHCGCNVYHHSQNMPGSSKPGGRGLGQLRRGNYFAQYSRKFSVGNGPLPWVQEYSVTKETGKMLGTLVALAVARMVNLESFIWDMPTGVLRDVWIALASLADRPGHECRLERVWVRWHDNSDMPSVHHPGSSNGANSSSPAAQAEQSLFQRYGHVEYPTLSILPPLKSLSVLDIDEPSYVEEMGVLIERSRDRLRELRIGISLKAYLSDWLRPLEDRPSGPNPLLTGNPTPGWPRQGGILDILLGKGNSEPSLGNTASAARPVTIGSEGHSSGQQVLEQTDPSAGATRGMLSADSQSASQTLEDTPPTDQNIESVGISANAIGQPGSSVNGVKSPPNPTARTHKTRPTAAVELHRRRLKLEVLELERVFLSVPFLLKALDWCKLTSLTLLRCENHERLWKALRRQYAPSKQPRSASAETLKQGRKDVSPSVHYPLKIKCLHTDTVSTHFVLFLKDALAPNSLECLYLQEGALYHSTVTVDAIYRSVIRRQRASLKKILIDSTERTPAGQEVSNSHWRRWMFTREMVSFVTSGRMPELRELGMVIHYKDWHHFLQRLPNIPQLRALYLPNVDKVKAHVDPRELALQILDIVTLRPEIELCYVGIQTKCYEILENRSHGKNNAFDDADDSQDELLPASGNATGPGADDDVDDEDDDDDDEPDEDDDDDDDVSSNDDDDDDDSDVFYNTGGSYSDEDDASSDRSRPKIDFRLREILFYDDKISIFKARHGEL
ncbi:hypothetical protein VTN02DRAFT_3780 [Thermoascus thermophilus]